MWRKNQIIIAHQELAAIAICGRLVLSRWHVSVNHLNCEQVKTLKPELEGKDQHYLPDRLVASFALEDIQQTAIGQRQSRHLWKQWQVDLSSSFWITLNECSHLYHQLNQTGRSSWLHHHWHCYCVTHFFQLYLKFTSAFTKILLFRCFQLKAMLFSVW